MTTLRCIWEQQFEPREQGGQWRAEPALPAAQLINSRYDLDARYGKKRTTLWVGYKVHFTQTCDGDAPQLITHVQTAPAPIPDEQAVSAIHSCLAEKDLLPDQHLVDAGYVDTTNLIASRAGYGVDLVGPTLKNYWYQAETGYGITHFSISRGAHDGIAPLARCHPELWLFRTFRAKLWHKYGLGPLNLLWELIFYKDVLPGGSRSTESAEELELCVKERLSKERSCRE